MTVLLLALFGGGALLAIASLIISAKSFAAAVQTIGGQLDQCAARQSRRQSAPRSQSRRSKPRLSWHPAVQQTAQAHGLRRDRMTAALQASGMRQISRRRQFSRAAIRLPKPLVQE
jgi:hypothetical protein